LWRSTPRQLQGWLALAARREKQEAAERLNLDFLAARGDPKDVNKTLRDLEK
jgi:hypothetical protein